MHRAGEFRWDELLHPISISDGAATAQFHHSRRILFKGPCTKGASGCYPDLLKSAYTDLHYAIQLLLSISPTKTRNH